MTEPAPHLCDVCRTNEMVGVACSAFGAVSWAYCRECLVKPAEPECMFAYLFDHVSNNGDGLIDAVKEYSTFRDGRYLTWAEYVEQRRGKITVTAQEMREGFAKGRTLIQEEWSSPDEIRAVDRLLDEGRCVLVQDWLYENDCQCMRRIVEGVRS